MNSVQILCWGGVVLQFGFNAAISAAPGQAGCLRYLRLNRYPLAACKEGWARRFRNALLNPMLFRTPAVKMDGLHEAFISCADVIVAGLSVGFCSRKGA